MKHDIPRKLTMTIACKNAGLSSPTTRAEEQELWLLHTEYGRNGYGPVCQSSGARILRGADTAKAAGKDLPQAHGKVGSPQKQYCCH